MTETTPITEQQPSTWFRKIVTGGSLVMVLLVLFVSVGCGSRKLDRGRVQEMMDGQLKSTPPLTHEFPAGRTVPGTVYEKLAEMLQSKGVITYTVVGEVKYPPGHMMPTTYTIHDIELTPEGQKYKVGETVHTISPQNMQQKYYLMKVADQSLEAITGIRENASGDSATVEFTWKYINVTPFGEAASLISTYGDRLEYKEGTVFSGTVVVTRYDDGWRLPSNWRLPVQVPR